jgi:hypothetical protein
LERNRQFGCYLEETLWPKRIYIELSRRGFEVSKITARGVFVAVAVTDRARLFGQAKNTTPRLVEAS